MSFEQDVHAKVLEKLATFDTQAPVPSGPALQAPHQQEAPGMYDRFRTNHPYLATAGEVGAVLGGALVLGAGAKRLAVGGAHGWNEAAKLRQSSGNLPGALFHKAHAEGIRKQIQELELHLARNPEIMGNPSIAPHVNAHLQELHRQQQLAHGSMRDFQTRTQSTTPFTEKVRSALHGAWDNLVGNRDIASEQGVLQSLYNIGAQHRLPT